MVTRLRKNSDSRTRRFIEAQSDFALGEMQICMGQDRFSPITPWSTYEERVGYDETVHGVSFDVKQLRELATEENLRPFDVANMARETMVKRAEEAEEELESASDYVNWNKTPIRNLPNLRTIFPQSTSFSSEYLSVKPSYDLIWAWIFGEPLYLYTRQREQGALLSPWHTRRDRVRRSDVKKVLFAVITNPQEVDNEALIALMELVDGQFLVIRYFESSGNTDFELFSTMESAIESLHPLEVKAIGETFLLGLAMENPRRYGRIRF